MFAVCCLVLIATALAGAEDSLNFLIVGDWGGKPSAPYYTTAEQRVSEAMGKKAAEVGSLFTVGLGDNFYDYGVKNVDDPRLRGSFPDWDKMDGAAERVGELRVAVKGLAVETKRLQTNLDRLHVMQTKLASISRNWATWMERSVPKDAHPTSP